MYFKSHCTSTQPLRLPRAPASSHPREPQLSSHPKVNQKSSFFGFWAPLPTRQVPGIPAAPHLLFGLHLTPGDALRHGDPVLPPGQGGGDSHHHHPRLWPSLHCRGSWQIPDVCRVDTCPLSYCCVHSGLLCATQPGPVSASFSVACISVPFSFERWYLETNGCEAQLLRVVSRPVGRLTLEITKKEKSLGPLFRGKGQTPPHPPLVAQLLESQSHSLFSIETRCPAGLTSCGATGQPRPATGAYTSVGRRCLERRSWLNSLTSGGRGQLRAKKPPGRKLECRNEKLRDVTYKERGQFF